MAGLIQPRNGPALGDLYKRVAPEEAAFIRAAALMPHDDGPRLEYADWLDRARISDWAKAIRAACDWERNGQFWVHPGHGWAPFDPCPYPKHRWWDPVGLVKWWAGRTEPAASLKAAGGVRFRQVRGLPGQLFATADGAAALLRSDLAVFDAFPVTALDMHDVARPVLERLFANPRVGQIDDLRLSGGRPAELDSLSDRMRLRCLALRHVSLGPDRDLGFLRAGYDALRVLDISCTDVSDRGLETLAGLKGLRALDIACTDVSTEGVAHLRTLTGLEDLDVGSCLTLPNDVLRHIGPLPRLTRLDVTETAVDDRGLEHLAQFPALEVLLLHDYKGVTDRGADLIVSLAREGHFSRLKGLYIDGSGITTTGRRRLGKEFDRRVLFG